MIRELSLKEGRGLEEVVVHILDAKIVRNVDGDPEEAVAATSSVFVRHYWAGDKLQIDVYRKGLEDECSRDDHLEALIAFCLVFQCLDWPFVLCGLWRV